MLSARKTQRYWLCPRGPADYRIVDTQRPSGVEYAQVGGTICSFAEALRQLDHMNYRWRELREEST